MTLFTLQALATTPFINPDHSFGNRQLKILSWNIYMLPYISLFNNNGERAKVIASTLQTSDYQIIVFQEAFSSKCRHIMAQYLAKAYPYQYGPVNKNNLPFRTNSGLWVVSKIPLTELGQIQFSLSKGFDMVARKGSALFQGNFEGSTFQLLTTHLQADNSSEVRVKQCDEIRDHLLNKFYNPHIPQLICGDFNIDMDDRPNYQQMLQTLDAQNGELSGAVKVTYDEVNNNLAKIANGKRRIIDYVLVRNGNLIHNIERKVQTFFSQVGGRASNLSDHYAMEFNVNFATIADPNNSNLISAVR
ncbi:MAG: sphingomyelin phosphodiesterase [Bacteroidota bacterium]|nr:sphingomyelin phosphodiesterase [Bacteroidota bacterium]